MMVQTKGGKRKGKATVVEEVSNSSSEEEDEEELEPPRKLTKAERKALNQIRGGQGTSKKQRKNNGGGGQGSNQEQAAQAPPQQPQPRQEAEVEVEDKTLGEAEEMGAAEAIGRIGFASIDIYANIRGEVYDFEGNLIDPNVEGGMRKEAFERMGRDLPTTFRLTSPEEVERIELEAAMESLTTEDAKTANEGLSEEQERILQRAQTVVRKMTRCRETFVQVCADMNEEWLGLPQVFLFGRWDRDGQGGLTDVTASQPGLPSAGRLMAATVLSRPAFKRPATAGLAQARRARRPPRPRTTPEEGPSQLGETEIIPIEEDDGEEGELLRAEDERQAKQWAMEREPETGKADVREGELKKKKQAYTIPIEHGLNIEQIVDWILESQRDLFTLKEFLAASPKIREEFRHRLSRKKVMTIKMSDIFPQEISWAPPGTKMDWHCVATGLLKVQVGPCEYSALIDDGAEMNIIREREALGTGPTTFGKVLIQKNGEGRERPLRFESRTLNEAERRYSQFKKETLAVLHCFRIFRNYVFGRRFILRVDPTALAQSLKNYSPSDPTIIRWLIYIWMFDFEIERIAGAQNRADGLSRIEWDSSKDQAEDSVPVDGFLEMDEQQLSINVWEYISNASSRPGKSIWSSPSCYQKRSELVMREPFTEEDPWGEQSAEQMMRLALCDPVQLSEEPLTIERGHEQGDEVLKISGGMVFLVNSLIQEDRGKLMLEEGKDSEIKEAFREEEYDGIYKKIGLWLNGDLNEAEIEPKIREKAKDFVVRQGHLFKKFDDGMPKRIVCGVPRQLDVIATLHDGITGGHRSARVTLRKIQHLYFWDGMGKMVVEFCNSCVPYQKRSNLRYAEPLNPRYVVESGGGGAIVVRLLLDWAVRQRIFLSRRPHRCTLGRKHCRNCAAAALVFLTVRRKRCRILGAGALVFLAVRRKRCRILSAAAPIFLAVRRKHCRILVAATQVFLAVRRKRCRILAAATPVFLAVRRKRCSYCAAASLGILAVRRRRCRRLWR
ncbi:hypothetical protein CBR_g41100 [Chara braunii]|uniref:Peptidase A2 domain-containing protein n=1 Tax=Chara braunii TaxID=69332 RepID=A0A388LV42_CHABU|nr:hypothetical protein CBR_g41100 [Chara braunii]|eukprot:GBG86196.1 hypothetical protein CBR_g41100 [Chara braunii]